MIRKIVKDIIVCQKKVINNKKAYADKNFFCLFLASAPISKRKMALRAFDRVKNAQRDRGNEKRTLHKNIEGKTFARKQRRINVVARGTEMYAGFHSNVNSVFLCAFFT